MFSTLLFGPQPQSAPLFADHQQNAKQTTDKKPCIQYVKNN